MIFGRTDLRKGVSGAKFDGQADFEIRLALAPPKPGQNSKKLKFRSENFAKKRFGASKNNIYIASGFLSGAHLFPLTGVVSIKIAAL